MSSCRDVRLLVLEPSRWSIVQRYGSIVKGLTLDQLLTFVRALKAELYAEGLVQGNFTSTVSTPTLALLPLGGFHFYACTHVHADEISLSAGLRRSLKASCGASWSEYPAVGLKSRVNISFQPDCFCAARCSSARCQQRSPFPSRWWSCLQNITCAR